MYVYMYLTFSKRFPKLTLTERTTFLFLVDDEKKFKAKDTDVLDENFLSSLFLRHSSDEDIYIYWKKFAS